MSHFITTLLLWILALAGLGWATYWVHHSHGPAGERVFRSLFTLLISGLVLLLTFGVNYVMASTGLKRSFGSEKIVGDDPIARTLFGGSHMRSNHLFALAIVVISFVGVSYLLKFLGMAFEAVRSGTWRQNRVDFVLLLIKLAIVSIVTIEFLRLDTSLLLARSALMMYSEQYGAMGAGLPTPDAIIRDHSNEIGGSLLSIMMLWYPLYILVAEKYFASSRAHFNAACHDLAASRAEAALALNGAPVAAAPGGAARAPIAPAPMQVQGVVLGDVPEAVVVGAPRAPRGAPGPGGAEDFIRPIPFNPGPVERNGVGNHA